jgi:hypothetical protein
MPLYTTFRDPCRCRNRFDALQWLFLPSLEDFLTPLPYSLTHRSLTLCARVRYTALGVAAELFFSGVY